MKRTRAPLIVRGGMNQENKNHTFIGIVLPQLLWTNFQKCIIEGIHVAPFIKKPVIILSAITALGVTTTLGATFRMTLLIHHDLPDLEEAVSSEWATTTLPRQTIWRFMTLMRFKNNHQQWVVTPFSNAFDGYWAWMASFQLLFYATRWHSLCQ